jgi:hypothetical protein
VTGRPARGVRAAALAATTLTIALALPADALAQPAEEPPAPAMESPWKTTLELAGSLFIGNEPQSVLTTRARTSHADSTFELGGDVRFVYGEGSAEGAREVSQRLWFASVNLDLWPFASHSPFLLGTVESSLARRVELRVSAGVGHKMTFVDSERALANLSIALLAERSRLPTTEGTTLTESLARLSARVRLRRKIGTRAELGYETYFRPELESLTRYTFTNSSSATYAMTERLDLKLTYLDNYDSEARARGARSNYDGQVVVGVAADF